jgi:hypothetical protein
VWPQHVQLLIKQVVKIVSFEFDCAASWGPAEVIVVSLALAPSREATGKATPTPRAFYEHAQREIFILAASDSFVRRGIPVSRPSTALKRASSTIGSNLIPTLRYSWNRFTGAGFGRLRDTC